ncbi:MAG: NAD(P)H-binding protein [Candidatus Eisenbacteria bacterium]
MIQIRKAAIFGAGGATGYWIARELRSRGIPTRVVGRDRERLRARFDGTGAEMVAADVADLDAARHAAAGCSLLVHCIGLPYPEFARHPVLARRTVEAAHSAGARILQVSSYYSYEPVVSNPVTEAHPRNPRSWIARMRKEAEDILLDAGAAVTHLPDFYGPQADLSLANPAIRAILQGKRADWIAPLDVPRQFLFVPDAAPILVSLALREEAYGQRWNVATTGAIPAQQFLEIAGRLSGKPVRVRAAGRNLLRMAGLFRPFLRFLAQLYPLYAHPPILDASKIGALLGPFESTPYEEGIRRTLDWMTASSSVSAATGPAPPPADR